MSDSTTHAGVRELRVRGLTVFVGLVVLGLASGAGLFYWEAARLTPPLEWEETDAQAPPEARLRYWFQKYGAPQLHRALMAGRLSAQRPWLATHVVQPRPEAGTPYAPELWGIDLSNVGPEMASVDGMQLCVDLPAPRMLERTREIPGEIARRLPISAPGEPFEAAADVARERARAFLSPVLTALSRKLPGVTLEVRIAAAGAASLPAAGP
ncbi:MAG: hypothetical protein FJ299_02945 [Planctomycetes bacterium]|nr:hypothetical protein [Planctomycetota bacterium]